VRQFGVSLERRHILPAGVNVELIAVSHRVKRAVCKTAWLRARRALDGVHGILHFASLSCPSMESGEYKHFHDDSLGLARPGVCFVAPNVCDEARP
jgi:hypothetical protein